MDHHGSGAGCSEAAASGCEAWRLFARLPDSTRWKTLVPPPSRSTSWAFRLPASPRRAGREGWSRFRAQPEIILDGAHNPAGARALADYIRRFYSGRRIWMVYGVMRDKAVDEMAALLFPLADRVIVTAPDNSRAMPPEEIPAPGATITHTVAAGRGVVGRGRSGGRDLHHRLALRGGRGARPPRTMKPVSLLRALLITDPLIVLATIVYGTASLLVSFFDPARRKQNAVERAWARALLAGQRRQGQGGGSRKNHQRRQLCVRVQSSELHGHARGSGKYSGALPVPGQTRPLSNSVSGLASGRAGHIRVPREDARAAVKTMTLAAQVVREEGISLLIFPEGGRSRTGEMRDFKEGAAFIAIKAGVPLVPMALERNARSAAVRVGRR